MLSERLREYFTSLDALDGAVRQHGLSTKTSLVMLKKGQKRARER